MNFKKQVSFLFLICLFPLLHRAQVITPFSNIYQTTQKGGIVFLSNVALGCSANPPTATGTCATGSAEMPPSGTWRDNVFVSAYVDVDNDANTFMSSSDSLNLPSCSQISKAYLFWGASGDNTSNRTTIKMKVNNGSYQTITASYSQTNTTGFNTYHCYADVTALLSSGGIRSRVFVADIPSGEVGNSNTFGSWNLVVVYRNDLLTMRQLTIFSGLANISNGNPVVNVPISGFLTPLSGPVTFEVGMYVHDGDRGSTGDDLKFNGAGTFLNLTDAVNPGSDVMNSTVAYNGTLTPFRNPNMNNTAGLDADIYVPDNSGKTYIGNAATTCTFQMTTNSETYLPQVVTTAIDVYEPDVRASVTARDVNGGLLVPGDIIEYRVKGVNIGSDPSVNTYLVDTLDIKANYIPNSTRILFGPNSGTMTDIAGDDQAEFNATTRVLKVRIGLGANAVIGGTVINSSSGADSTIITYSVMATTSCIKIGCNSTIFARAYIYGTGAVSSNTYNNASNPGIYDTNGCPLPGTTASPITATGCAVPTASNNSPACLGTNVIFSSPSDSDPTLTYLWSGPLSYTSAIQNPTLTNFSSGMAGIYNVTLAIPSSTCKAVLGTTVTVNLCPTAVNDVTNTIQNTPVTGNASTNDINSTGGTFSISGQPTGGVLVINPATGQYTFTPSPTFTGVTTATYVLCNGSPVVCSTATITFTVYPTLTAHTDIVNTTPSVSVTGSLLPNDNGIVPNATYSVSITQPPGTVGSFTINPVTGQYTFAPHPAFVGTAQTTYTVCNTSVLPIVCSPTNIIINVFPNPAPVNDATNTAINTPVVANAGTNDGGTAGGSFSITNQPAGGTITINPATGQFTFTPSPTFTGVTTATYVLCNGAPVTCSPAVITITVYPAIQANPDVVNTTPSVSVGGNVLNNDNGIVTNATYSVTITQPASSTGTFVYNPATGQYTFIPNPNFIGTAQTTYTVCNTSVNPVICSNTTITINVFPNPAPVNDATLTLINTPVSGNAGANDGGTTGGSFSITGQPNGGTIVMNPANGQFTFTPNSGFTGITTATYVLCNGAPVTCSTAIITITVYPNIEANPDYATTPINTPVSGTVLINDTGMVPGGSYSVTVSPTPSGQGSITIDPATGQYTFVPVTGFTGTVVTTYTLCQYNGTVQLQCTTSTITIVVGAKSLVGIAKSLGTVNYNNDGSANFTYKITVKNMGNQPLTNVTVSDNLTATFPSPSTYTVVNAPVVTSAVGSQITTDNTYSGAGSSTLLTIPLSSSLAVGRTDTLMFSVKVNPNGYSGVYNNQATVSAVGSGTFVTDVSGNGNNPDEDGDGDPGNNGSPTSYTVDFVRLGLAKSAGKSQSIGGGCYEVQFKFTVKNYGAATVYNINLFDDLNQTFTSPATYTVLTPITVANGYLLPNPNYTGNGANTNLLISGSQLGAGKTDTLYLKVRYCYSGTNTFSNTALVNGSSQPNGGFVTTDVSTDGKDPDKNDNNNPNDAGEDTPTVFYPTPEFSIPEGFSPNNDGVNDVFVIRGLEEFPDNEISILNRWGNVVYKKKGYNSSWDGTANQGLSFGGDQLPEGTYFYILELGKGVQPVKGFIYLNRASR